MTLHRGDHFPAGRLSSQLRATPPGQRHLAVSGQLTRQSFDLRDLHGGKHRTPAGSGQISQTRQPFSVEPSAPLPDSVDMQTKIGSDASIGEAISGGEDDPSADHVAVGPAGSPDPAGQFDALVVGQDDHERGRDDHDLVVHPLQGLPDHATPRGR